MDAAATPLWYTDIYLDYIIFSQFTRSMISDLLRQIILYRLIVS